MSDIIFCWYLQSAAERFGNAYNKKLESTRRFPSSAFSKWWAFAREKGESSSLMLLQADEDQHGTGDWLPSPMVQFLPQSEEGESMNRQLLLEVFKSVCCWLHWNGALSAAAPSFGFLFPMPIPACLLYSAKAKSEQLDWVSNLAFDCLNGALNKAGGVFGGLCFPRGCQFYGFGYALVIIFPPAKFG